MSKAAATSSHERYTVKAALANVVSSVKGKLQLGRSCSRQAVIRHFAKPAAVRNLGSTSRIGQIKLLGGSLVLAFFQPDNSPRCWPRKITESGQAKFSVLSH